MKNVRSLASAISAFNSWMKDNHYWDSLGIRLLTQ